MNLSILLRKIQITEFPLHGYKSAPSNKMFDAPSCDIFIYNMPSDIMATKSIKEFTNSDRSLLHAVDFSDDHSINSVIIT